MDTMVAIKLRAVLIVVLGAGMIAVGVAIVASLHLRVRVPQASRPGSPLVTHTAKPAAQPPPAASFHFPLTAVLYGLLIVALVAAVLLSVVVVPAVPRVAAVAGCRGRLHGRGSRGSAGRGGIGPVGAAHRG